MGKISRDIAEKEVNGWLDNKKISASKREAKKDNIEVLVCGIMDGELVMNKDFTITQSLRFPLSESAEGIKQLIYKSRLSVAQTQACLKGVKMTEAYSLISSFVAVLTGQHNEAIVCMDSEDFSTAQAIASFFLP